jgi:hypothetical protein
MFLGNSDDCFFSEIFTVKSSTNAETLILVQRGGYIQRQIQSVVPKNDLDLETLYTKKVFYYCL